MSEISVLPDNLVNKIAAGEVVERPSSVVKELVENSLDAGATQIRIEIELGGTKLIKISDNGEGIAKDFLALALKRHATSKLSSLEDLERIDSLGFRGEALPSIASVSLFEITSKTADQLSGYKIKIAGGKMLDSGEIGAPDGTMIEVRELFYNTPARRKFLKTQLTETRHIIDTLNGLALAFPECGFELICDSRQMFAYRPGGEHQLRVREILGANDFAQLLDFSEETEKIRLFGYTVKPNYARKNKALTYFIVNGRRIDSKLLYSALRTAYGEFLIKGRYPMAVIYLFVDPATLDVNVSPTKSEVRFSDERAIFTSLMLTVKKRLARDDVIPQESIKTGSAEGESVQAYKARIQSATEKFFNNQKTSEINNQPSFKMSGGRRPATLEEINPEIIKADNPGQISKNISSAENLQSREPIIGITPYRVEQLGDLFIVAFARDQMTIIDQHAAHERILYEKALKSFENQKMTSQKLLMPINVEMEPIMLTAAEQYFELLGSLGFELERFGPRSLAIYGIPAVTSGKNPEILVRDLISDLLEYEDESTDRFKLAAQRFACRAAIKAGDKLSEQMMRGLVKALFESENPYICPHGRPTIIKYSIEGLKARFGR